MNRELKFRAWYKPWNSFAYLCSIDFVNKQYGISGPEDFDELLVSFDSCELQQFSGFVDKNNNPIYDGDIVRLCINDDPEDLQWELQLVKLYDEGEWRIINEVNLEERLCNFIVNDNKLDLEVVGNSFEDADLLQ